MAEVYGLMAEFGNPADLTTAVHRARQAGYRELEAFSPIPVEEVHAALGPRRTWVPALTLFGGLIGIAAAYLLQHYMNVSNYPLNVGGTPAHSWPAFAVVTIETGILIAALAAVVGMFALNGLPRPHHPVFNAPSFTLASQSRFFLCIQSTDPRFDPDITREFLVEMDPAEVWIVPLGTGNDETGN